MIFYLHHLNFGIIFFCFFTFSPFVTGQDQTISYSDDILNWEAPQDLLKRFPYYLSGHKDGVPVWIMPSGKMDIRTYFEEGGKVEDLLKYFEQMITRMVNPKLYKEKEEDDGETVNTFIIIADMDGYTTRQLTHIPTVQLSLTITKMFVDILDKNNMKFQKGIIVNNNFVFQSLWTLMKPILGQLASEMELYGTNPDKWKPVLINEIGKDQLPEYLGGVEGHTYVQTFG